MSEPSDISDRAKQPKKVTGDAGSVEQFPLDEQIEADRYERAREEVEKPHRGLRFTKMVPPGTV